MRRLAALMVAACVLFALVAVIGACSKKDEGGVGAGSKEPAGGCSNMMKQEGKQGQFSTGASKKGKTPCGGQ